MEAKEAVAAAKRHLSDIFAAELSAAPTLEEIWFEPREEVWYVTFGIRRALNADQASQKVPRLGLDPFRDYKVVRISDADGRPLSIRDRLSQAIAS